MLHFVKQFKRKKTTFENFFVQKTNAEYTVTDNAQEAFPEKPCGRTVKAVVPCLLKINLHFSKPHLRKTAVENGQRTMHKGFFPKTLWVCRQARCSLPIEKILHFSKPTPTENEQRTKAFLKNALFLICDTSRFQHAQNIVIF